MAELSYSKTKYFHVGRASDLSGYDRHVYRALEMFPGLLSWGTLFATVFFSWYAPVATAIFIITFDTFWLLKTLYLSVHLYASYKRMQKSLSTNWEERLTHFEYDHLYHMILLPFYKESLDVIEHTIEAILNSKYDPKKILLVVAGEERALPYTETALNSVRAKYEKKFGYLLTTIHPKDTEGEIAGKGSNITYAAEQARVEILDKLRIPYTNVIVSAFDMDTVVYAHYFNCLTWHFLVSENPYRTSFQPIPLYNNNLWDAPAVSRVAALSGTFWQMIQQERPEKLVTFSSHAICFQTLYEIQYWQRNMVSEDSRIFWNAFLAYNGNYTVTPIGYPVSMDANLAETTKQTLINIYKQHRRWMWGAESVPYILFGFIKNKEIPFWKKVSTAIVQIDGYWSLATNPIFIFLLGWLPLVLGGYAFNQSVLSYNLPIMTRNIMTLSMIGMVVSAILSFKFLPKRAGKEFKISKKERTIFLLQWLLVPINILVFGAIPGLEAQTRLLFGRYMGFWVTPKHRK